MNSNGNAVGVAVIAMTSDWDLKEDLKLATVSGYVLGPALKPWFYGGKHHHYLKKGSVIKLQYLLFFRVWAPKNLYVSTLGTPKMFETMVFIEVRKPMVDFFVGIIVWPDTGSISR